MEDLKPHYLLKAFVFTLIQGAEAPTAVIRLTVAPQSIPMITKVTEQRRR
jgi:hypothetical protein